MLFVRFIDFAIYLNLIYWPHLVRNGCGRFTLWHIRQLKNCSSTEVHIGVAVVMAWRGWRLPQIANERFHFLFLFFSIRNGYRAQGAYSFFCVDGVHRNYFGRMSRALADNSKIKKTEKIFYFHHVVWHTHIICLLLSAFPTFFSAQKLNHVYALFPENIYFGLRVLWLVHFSSIWCAMSNWTSRRSERAAARTNHWKRSLFSFLFSFNASVCLFGFGFHVYLVLYTGEKKVQIYIYYCLVDLALWHTIDFCVIYNKKNIYVIIIINRCHWLVIWLCYLRVSALAISIVFAFRLSTAEYVHVYLLETGVYINACRRQSLYHSRRSRLLDSSALKADYNGMLIHIVYSKSLVTNVSSI